jgi:hypothetical protein
MRIIEKSVWLLLDVAIMLFHISKKVLPNTMIEIRSIWRSVFIMFSLLVEIL